jgi:predicted DNA-binding transcriptional regulator AlpA
MTDPLLTVREVAGVLGVTAGAVRSLRSQGYLPEPDEPDEETVPNRRTPRWRTSTITTWLEDGRPRARAIGESK